ncbi:MAG: (2Fe-2S)-binding protein, partial [Candidatus Limnocylindrales bacterium]
AVAEGASSVDDVAERCGAGTCCGACVPTVASLVRGNHSSGADLQSRSSPIKSPPSAR